MTKELTYKERKYLEGSVKPLNVLRAELLIQKLDFKTFVEETLKLKNAHLVKQRLDVGTLTNEQIYKIAQFISVNPDLLRTKK